MHNTRGSCGAILFFSIHDTVSYAKPVFFSSLDLRSSFHSLIVDDESIKYTAFQSHLGQIEFLRAPFGIKTIPSHLIRAMSLILAEKEGPLMKSALAYVDDVLCYLGSVEEQFTHLREILQRFRASKMKLSAKKCSFLLPEIVFLGNLVNAQGIGHDSAKVLTMMEFPVPTCQKKLKGALGMFQFYKKFIPNYSTIVIFLNKLLLQKSNVQMDRN